MADHLKNVHYDAFISYRHSEFDSFVVENLHKKLESFKLPKSVLKKVKNGKTKIERVFRDVDELPLADNLSEPIDNALRNSDYLITVCTPRYPQSRWCMKEIEVFLQYHPRDHILVVLAEDEPVNSFPEILTFEETETVDEKGEKVIIRKELEPLAADTRGENRKEVLKAMDTAVIKLCAAMFGLNYDDLRQRHREQKMRRMAAVFGSAGVAVLGFAIFATASLIKISRQNETITTQYAELQDRFASSMATASEKLMGEGRRKDAVYLVRNVLPENGEGEYNESALSALYSAMDVYKVSSGFSPQCTYDAEAWLNNYGFSSDDKSIMLNDGSSIFVYDVATGKKLSQVKRNKRSSADSYFVAAFCGPDGYIVADANKTTYYSLDGSDSRQLDIEGVTDIYQSEDGESTIVSAQETIYLLDPQGNIISEYDMNELFGNTGYHIDSISFDNSDVVLTMSDYNRTFLLIIDGTDGEVSKVCEYPDLSTAVKKEGIIYLIHNGMFDDDYGIRSSVAAMDAESGEELWNRMLEEFTYSYQLPQVSEEFIYLADSYTVFVLDRQTGRLSYTHPLNDCIVGQWLEGETFSVIQCNGTSYSCEGQYIFEDTSFFTKKPDEDIAEGIFRNSGNLFIFFMQANYLSGYTRDVSPYAEQYIDDYEYEYAEYLIADDDLKEREEFDANIMLLDSAFYSNDMKYIVAYYTDHTLKIYDNETAECVYSYTTTDNSFDMMYYSNLAGCYILSGNRSLILDDKMNIICETNHIISEENDGFIIVNDSGDNYKIPFIGNSELIKQADAYLDGYVPSDEILEKYGVK